MKLTFVVAQINLDYYVDLFLRTKRASAEPATVVWYERVLSYYTGWTAHVYPDWPHGLDHTLAFFEGMNARKLSKSSKNNYYRAINAFFNWLMEANLINSNPLGLLKKPKQPGLLPVAPRQHTLKRLFETVEQGIEQTKKEWFGWYAVRDKAMFSLALDTGARIGEIEGMRLADVNLVQQHIRIYAPKTDSYRLLMLSDKCVLDLMHWKTVRLEKGLSAPSLFVARHDKPLTTWGMRHRLNRWLEEARIPHFKFNALRHAYAIYSLRNNADLLDISAQMGHKNIKTTAIYLRATDDDRMERHRQTSGRLLV